MNAHSQESAELQNAADQRRHLDARAGEALEFFRSELPAVDGDERLPQLEKVLEQFRVAIGTIPDIELEDLGREMNVYIENAKIEYGLDERTTQPPHGLVHGPPHD